MERRTVVWAAAILALAVIFGAFGAHALKARLSPEALGQWNTGVQYQFYHGLGILSLMALQGRYIEKNLRAIRLMFMAGLFLFSGSLYLLSTRELLDTQSLTPILGPITPIGGLLLIGGWVLLLITALGPKPQH